MTRKNNLFTSKYDANRRYNRFIGGEVKLGCVELTSDNLNCSSDVLLSKAKNKKTNEFVLSLPRFALNLRKTPINWINNERFK